MKDPENPVTIADLTIQKTIEHVLTSLWPSINIIGEEDPESYKSIKPLMEVKDIKRDTITEEFLAKSFEQRREQIENGPFKNEVLEDPYTFTASDLSVWIDPIDGTRELVAGRLENVTCMIGVVKDKVPIMGLVHRPYVERTGTIGETFFGSLEFGIFKTKFDRTWDAREIEKRDFHYMAPFDSDDDIIDPDNHILNVNVCWHRENAQNEECLETLKPCKFVEDGGAGKRVLRVLDDINEMWVFPGYGQSGWDMCGPEALIRGRMGITTDFYEERFQYTKEIDPIRGCIFAKNQKLYELALKRMGQFLPYVRTLI
jgi:3'-phosphoadenosine 5'-phosphosulfate (PAPS) 3'-phosphatase